MWESVVSGFSLGYSLPSFSALRYGFGRYGRQNDSW